jgi:serpin B
MTFGALRVPVFLGLMILVGGCVGAHPNAPPADRAEGARGNNAFALDLYARLRGRQGNLFFSPASLSTALGMTYAGARGQTADEMAKALHFTLGPDRLHPALGSLLHDLTSGSKKGGQQLSVANALWAQKGHPFLPEFVRLTRDNYGAGLNEVDFRGDTEQARRAINTWVAERTRDRIKDLLQEGMLDADTRLVLTNAIYFKGDWDAPFPKSLPDRTL